jgi:putative tryptophan/tyrosine transport system substrate-binding protein
MAKKKKVKVAAKRTIGIMHSGTDKPAHQIHIDAFIQALEAAGYDEAKTHNNLDIKARLFAEDDPGKLTGHAKSLINSHHVEVVVAAGGTASALAAKSVTDTQMNPTSVVFTSFADPASPVKNMTGICARTTELDATRLHLLHELMPNETKFGALVNSSRGNYSSLTASLNAEATKLGLQQPDYTSVVGGGTTNEIDDAIEKAFSDWHGNVKAAVVTADPLFNNHRDTVIAAARKYKIAAIYQWSEFANAGGLMSYGTNLLEAYKLAGIYVGRILDGDNPDKLPVVLLTNFELVINLGTASKIGIPIPQTLYARATIIP